MDPCTLPSHRADVARALGAPMCQAPSVAPALGADFLQLFGDGVAGNGEKLNDYFTESLVYICVKMSDYN